MWRPAILQRAEAALLDEKAAKLTGIARVLDQALGESFAAHLERAGVAPDASPEVRLIALQQALAPITDQIAAAFPRVGLGYYDAELDRIVAYAPSGELGYLVGVRPPDDHMGRLAMESRTDQLAIGSMVRGDAMNCMHPLVREGRVIGFSFANESVEDIYRQIQQGQTRTDQPGDLSWMLGLSSLAVFAGTSGLSARTVRAELQQAVERGRVSGEAVRPLLMGLGQIERHLHLFLHNLEAGVVLVDAAGRVDFCNEGLTALTGCDRERMTGRPWREVRTLLGLPEELADRPARGTETHRVVGVRAAGADGVERTLDILATTVPSIPGEPPSRLILLEDTERTRRQESRFERAERLALAGELATAIAHEIRNPLTVVAGSIQLIPDRLDDVDFLLSLADKAGRELQRVNRIIQGLLGFARYAEPRMQQLDLNERVQHTVEFIRFYARKHGVEIETHLAPVSLRIQGDAEHLQQALLNLMVNGIQAMPEGGRLTVTTELPPGGRMARVAIRDEGVGIEPEQLSRIWEVFYSSKPGGTGLGLPVVHRIVDEHKGYVEVESTPGRGTCFTISLPLITRMHLTEE